MIMTLLICQVFSSPLVMLFILLMTTISPATSAVAAFQSDECNTARQRFRTMPFDLILRNLFLADVVFESGKIENPNEVHVLHSVTMPVKCFHKGYLNAPLVRVSLIFNSTSCIDEHTIEATLASEGDFVFFLRRLSNGSFIMLDGGVAKIEAFNAGVSVICELQTSHTMLKSCPHQPSQSCGSLAVFNSTELAKEERQPYVEPEESSTGPMFNDDVQTSYSKSPASRLIPGCLFSSLVPPSVIILLIILLLSL